MAKKKTNEQFLKELKEHNPNIIALEKYKGVFEKIKFKCLIDDYEWETMPCSVLNNRGCPLCGKKSSSEKRLDSKEEFLSKFRNNNKHFSDIELLDEYKNSKTKILCKCKIDGNEWYARPKDLIQGSGCKICGQLRTKNNKLKSKEQYVEQLNEVHKGNIELNGDYNGVNFRSNFKCNICGNEWSALAGSVLDGRKCKKCANLKLTKTDEQFIKELLKINKDIVPLEKYILSNKKIKYKCLKCGTIFSNTPHQVLSGRGCPVCSISKLEKITKAYFVENKIEYIPQYIYKDCKYIGLLRFDFYLPDYNICVECDGEQHYKPVNFGGASDEKALENFEQNKIRDEIKNKYCQENNIKLIRIPYWEKDNIEKILIKELNINCQ